LKVAEGEKAELETIKEPEVVLLINNGVELLLVKVIIIIEVAVTLPLVTVSSTPALPPG
jgi:hypothetical protein